MLQDENAATANVSGRREADNERGIWRGRVGKRVGVSSPLMLFKGRD